MLASKILCGKSYTLDGNYQWITGDPVKEEKRTGEVVSKCLWEV